MSAEGEPTTRFYTGQEWDAVAEMYYYNARFYDPKAARFLTMDPVREYMSPYAYVKWNPTLLADPSGNLTVPTPGLGLGMALEKMETDPKYRGWIGLLQFRAPGLGGFNGPNGGGPGGGAGHGGWFGGGSLQALRVAVAVAESTAQTVDVGVRTYAPFSRFGGGFDGDDKPVVNPDAKQSLTARVWTDVKVDSRTGGATQVTAHSDKTSYMGYGITTARATFSGQSNREGGFTVTTSAGNPAFLGLAPDIDTTLSANVQLAADSPSLTATLSGDGFPNTQVYVKLPSGSTFVLIDYQTSYASTFGGATYGPYVALWGQGEAAMGSFGP